MLKPLLLAAAIVAAGSTVAAARDYGWGSRDYRPYSRAEAFRHRAARDGRITEDEWRIYYALRAREGRSYRRSYRRSRTPSIYFRW